MLDCKQFENDMIVLDSVWSIPLAILWIQTLDDIENGAGKHFVEKTNNTIHKSPRFLQINSTYHSLYKLSEVRWV